MISRHVVFDEDRFLSSDSVSSSLHVQSPSMSTFIPLVRPPISEIVSRPIAHSLAPSAPHAGCSSISVTVHPGVGSDREPPGCSSPLSISSSPTGVVEEVSTDPMSPDVVFPVPVSNSHPIVT